MILIMEEGCGGPGGSSCWWMMVMVVVGERYWTLWLVKGGRWKVVVVIRGRWY